jgi:ABC-type branched-subunit amino acid transport system substrate-binding protein
VRSRWWLAASVLSVLVVASACSSSSKSSSSSTTAPASSAPSASASTGSFGTLKDLCGPGNASGATDRGVTDTAINVATFGDPGYTGEPGVEEEFFDAARGFVQWCNNAGGILGRKVHLDTLDAKLVNAAAVATQACQSDFMQVGGGLLLDSAAVAPRVACKLGQIPSYVLAPSASQAPLQAFSHANPVGQSTFLGPLEQIHRLYPNVKKAAYLNINLATIADLNIETKDALQRAGFTVDSIEVPLSVTNWRPYVEKMQSDNDQLIVYSNVPPTFFQAFKDVGFSPTVMFVPTYDTFTAAAAKEVGTLPFKAAFTFWNYWPLEMTSSNPALSEMVNAIKAATPSARIDAYDELGWDAWLLFADSAKSCGSNLTVTCVLNAANAHTDWTGGGIESPEATSSTQQQAPDCFAGMDITPNGYVYDKNYTKPNTGIFNCAPGNVDHVNIPS